MPAQKNDKAGNRPVTSPQLTLDLGYVTSHAEDDFLVSDGNELAVRHVSSWPEWPSPLTLLVGPPKSGKSHLARIWQERANAVAADPDVLEALATEGGMNPILVEDADSGDYPEEGLFHLLNQSMRDRRSLLLTARTEPEAWPLKTDDVRSRIRLAARFDMVVDDDTQLSHILVKLFADRQLRVDPKVLRFLANRMERSQEEAVILVDTLDKLALAKGSAITRALATQALEIRRKAHTMDQTVSE